ncbi:MAG: DUF2892 domain-containing protein [Planctomycetes bacterium]|nr:DUF2892 domain-containing protein [Planctomycetota bacterium]
MERILRGMAGTVTLASLLLAATSGTFEFAKPSWLWLTAFVGANLLQSAFTDWCPAMWLLAKLGVKRACAPRAA